MTEPLKTATETAYAAAADTLDDPALSFWDRFGRRTVDRLDLPRGAQILDACCGTGASAVPAARAVGPSGSVVGIDRAEPVLVRARAKAAALEEAWHPLPSPDDWWTVVLGTGFRATIEQLDAGSAQRVRAANLAWARGLPVTAIRTDVIYAVSAAG